MLFVKKATSSVRRVLLIGLALGLLAMGVGSIGTTFSSGTAYYVSASSGNDDWPGTETQPWRTLAKVSSTTFQPHDQILLKRGDMWEGEELVLQGSGDFMDDSWIVLGAYGEGPRPRLTNPPFDETLDVSESWSAICSSYPNQCRQFIKIAVHVAGSGWFISGLEIDNAEIGVYIPAGGARYWVEDMYLHDILGLFMPIPPDWLDCPSGCAMWDPYPSPAWGNAIHFESADYVTVRDIVIERATGGIGGFANVGWIENVFIDKVTTGGLNFNGNNVTIRYATVLNGQWPDGAWYGADPFISSWDSGWVVERSEVAYTDNFDYIPGLLSGVQDASPVDFDQETVNSAITDNFFHDNIGSCIELNMAGGNNRNITIANNVCYSNGLEDDPRPEGDYARVAFAADACGFHLNQSYTIQDNAIYKAFPGQHLNYYHMPEAFADDFQPAEQTCGTVVSNNVVYEYGEYSLPLPIPQPPPIAQTNIAPGARVSASSGAETAAFAQDDSLDTEWISAEAQPWIRFEWDEPQTIDTIRLFDRPDLENWAASGVLTFSDGSSLNVTGGLLNNGAMREVVFDGPKTVTWVEFAVTRNVPESPGTNVGLTELQVYLAAPPPPPAPAPDPGTFSVDFSDRPEAPTPLAGQQYPDGVNGIDWAMDAWTTAADPTGGNRYLYLDFPRDQYGKPTSRGPIFILPRGKVLRSVRVACPAGAVVAFFQPGQPTASVNCTGELVPLQTGWAMPVSSNIVSVWIDVSSTSAPISDVQFDDIVYGD